jgi:hypothetical protein
MATLSQQQLGIDQITGMPNHVTVTTTVRVDLDQLEEFLLNAGLILELGSSLWGIDGNTFNGGNDHLLSFSPQKITGDGIYTFSQVVHTSVINEDDSWLNRDDEIAAKLDLTSKSPIFPFHTSSWTGTIYGKW